HVPAQKERGKPMQNQNSTISTNPTPHRAAAYARYSTSNQTHLSIERQFYAIDEYCEREGLSVSGYYADEAQTGTNTNREGFTRLIADAEKHLFDTVIIYDMARGSRDVCDWFAFRKEMKRLGVAVISVTNKLGDIDNPDDFLTESITAVLGQHQVLQYRRDSIAGKRARARKGLFCGGTPPLGYDISGGHYVVNALEAPVVGMIFEMYAAGASYNDILAAVARTGVTGKTGRPILRNSLYYILSNERYTGRFAWFENEERYMHKHVGRKGSDPIVKDDIIPRLVSDETWRLVRRRMEENKTLGKGRGKGPNRQYLLAGLVRCGECGRPMTGLTTVAKGREYVSYSCLGKRNEHICDNKNIKAAPVEEYVVEAIRTHILNPERLRLVAEKFVEQYATSTTDEARAIRNELTCITNSDNHLVNSISQGHATPAVLKRLHENDARRVALEARQASISTPVEIDFDALLAALTADAATLANDPARAREMILRYVDSITVYHMYLDIVYSPNYMLPKNKKITTPDGGGCNLDGSSGAHPTLFTVRVNRSRFAA
ncbi:MAG: recombinase family protein, partial [Clostridia bacterium]|nr:recombinase family protein [Clostridia bacterium]